MRKLNFVGSIMNNLQLFYKLFSLTLYDNSSPNNKILNTYDIRY